MNVELPANSWKRCGGLGVLKPKNKKTVVMATTITVRKQRVKKVVESCRKIEKGGAARKSKLEAQKYTGGKRVPKSRSKIDGAAPSARKCT